jgi:hypothetical protein
MEFLTSFLIGLVLVEIYAWLPSLSRWIVLRAVLLLPTEHRDRWRDEFQEGQNALPVTAWRFVHALSLLPGVLRMSHDFAMAEREEAVEQLSSQIASVTSTYRDLSAKISEVVAKVAQSSEQRRTMASVVAHARFLSTGMSKDTIAKETTASVARALENYGGRLLDVSNRAATLLAVEVEKVSKALDDAAPLAARISRRWSYAQKGWRLSRYVPLLRLAVCAKFMESLRLDTRQLEVSLKVDDLINSNSVKAAERLRAAIMQSVDACRSRSS